MTDRAATPETASPNHDAPDSTTIGHAGALLTIDLNAIGQNYRQLRGMLAGATCAGVVKADGYGLGGERVVRKLVAEGCRHFFVAHLDEAIALRPAVPHDALLIVLHGPTPGAEPAFLAHGAIPVLNSPQQIAGWSALAASVGQTLPALLQVDSGMARFGLSEADFDALLQRNDGLAGIELLYIMSHLACADAPWHPANAAQLACFSRMRARLPQVKASLSASSGIFLGPDYHFDLVRPGAALYGIAPSADRPNPLAPVVRLQARIMQVREVPAGTPVGYGHTRITKRTTRLATAAIGYADGFRRNTAPSGAAWLGETSLPMLGRVSMDSIILDATGITIAPGDLVELIGLHHDVDAVAQAAGTIGYDILTGLGHRYARHFIG